MVFCYLGETPDYRINLGPKYKAKYDSPLGLSLDFRDFPLPGPGKVLKVSAKVCLKIRHSKKNKKIRAKISQSDLIQSLGSRYFLLPSSLGHSSSVVFPGEPRTPFSFRGCIRFRLSVSQEGKADPKPKPKPNPKPNPGDIDLNLVRNPTKDSLEYSRIFLLFLVKI